MTSVKLGFALGGLVVLAGCSSPPPPRVSQTVVYAADLQGGARSCTVPQDLTLTADAPTTAQMVVGNDGGWCGLMVALPGPHPYRLGLITARPQRGRVYIHTVGDATRISYTPDAGFVGEDAFAVRLMPDSRVVQVAVKVEPGPAAVATPAPTPAPAPATPARSTTRRRS